MPNAVELLREDHQKVKVLFERFEHEADEEQKGQIVDTALKALEVHTAIEEEIFYPAMRQEIGAEDLMDEADEEHHVAKQLMSELKGMRPGASHYDAKFTVLASGGEVSFHATVRARTSALARRERAALRPAPSGTRPGGATRGHQAGGDRPLGPEHGGRDGERCDSLAVRGAVERRGHPEAAGPDLTGPATRRRQCSRGL